MSNDFKRGFTLIELLIVIGILAILATVTVLVLNPAQLFAQARDGQRLNDLETMRNGISLYLSTVSSPDMNGGNANAECASGAGGKVYVYAAPTTQSFANRSGGNVAVGARGITGGSAGWLPVDFSAIPGGSPIANLPIDPTNSGDRIYRYACDQVTNTFEIDGGLESTRYTSGADNKYTVDGGDNSSFYEVGNDPGLDL